MAAKKKSKKASTSKSSPRVKAPGRCKAGCGVEQIVGATFCHHCNVPQ